MLGKAPGGVGLALLAIRRIRCGFAGGGDGGAGCCCAEGGSSGDVSGSAGEASLSSPSLSSSSSCCGMREMRTYSPSAWRVTACQSEEMLATGAAGVDGVFKEL